MPRCGRCTLRRGGGRVRGDLTRLLVHWAEGNGAKISAIDPVPQDGLVELEREHPELELIRETSLEALPKIEMPDVVIIDGDHNYFTVSEELRLIGERAGDLPLLLFHDVCWPHGRRDDYFDPEQIPADYRQPIAGNGSSGGIFPGEPELRPGGLPYPKSAAREGGARNGVLTAVEDFVGGRDDLRLAIVPAFFGFGVVWRHDAGYAAALGDVLDGWDRNTMVERLESNRVSTSPRAITGRRRSGGCRSASVVRRPSSGACSNRAPSRWPSACRGCASVRALAPASRLCRRTRSAAPLPISADKPYPPLNLANRVCSLEGRGDPVAAYESLGAEARRAIVELLPEDWSFEGKRVLDFGCGAGRTLRHFLTEAEAAELWGSDIDGASIDWLRSELCPPLNAELNERIRPLSWTTAPST